MSKDGQPIIAEALKLIGDAEGSRLTAYRDPVGIWTIGKGTTDPAYAFKGNKITKAKEEELFLRDVREAAAIVDAAVKVPITPEQRGALTSLVYNIGPGSKNRDGFVRLRKGGPSTLLRKLNAGDYEGASLEFGKWVHANGEVLPGLVKRRAAEQALFLRGTIKEEPKELESNIQPTNSEPAGPVATNKGVQATTVSAAGAVVSEAAKSFEPLVAYSEIIQYVFIILTVLSILYAVRGAKRG